MSQEDLQKLQRDIVEASAFIRPLKTEMSRIVAGQSELIDRLIAAMLADGHVLLEGLPGLAKTLAVKTLAQSLNGKFARIQFTPDLLPADVVGTNIYNPQEHTFAVKQGPVFANIVLADEINRAPAKVQSALLECMQEKQATVAGTTLKMPEPFLVLATQNPIEQEGTYPLPEAQIDRFIFKLKIDYPNREEGRLVAERMGHPECMPHAMPVRSKTRRHCADGRSRGLAPRHNRARRRRQSHGVHGGTRLCGSAGRQERRARCAPSQNHSLVRSGSRKPDAG